MDPLSRDLHRSEQTLTKISTKSYHNRQRHFPHQTAAQDRYLLDIIASVSLNASNGIAKATSTKQSGNWDRWGTFLKYSGITEKFLVWDPTRAEDNHFFIIHRLSATRPVRKNQETNTPP